MKKLKLLKSLPKAGDSLGDIHDGVPTIQFDGLRFPPIVAPVPVRVAKCLLYELASINSYINKALVVVAVDDSHIITAAYVYDDRKAAIVSYHYGDVEFTDEEAAQ